MKSLRLMLRSAIEPAVGVCFVLLWVMSEVGRFDPRNVAVAVLPFVMIGIAIALSRLAPFLALAVLGFLLLAQLVVPSLRFSETAFPAYLGFGIAAAVLGASANHRERHVSLPLVGIYGIVIALFFTIPALSPTLERSLAVSWGANDSEPWKNIALMFLAFVGVSVACWYIGFGTRARLERNRSETQRLAIAADLSNAESELRFASEHDRIAQDVHDIMAHSLSVIVAQADGARYLGDKRPEGTNDSLAAIARSARESLVEVRMLIDSLGTESEGHSHPTLDGLDALLERMRSAGLSVTHTVFGDAGVLTSGQQLAVYRIVQESLTNALKHAGASAVATVVFDWRGPGLALTISSRGEKTQPAAQSPQRGLRGMRERARLAGGWLAAGFDDDEPGRYVVTGFVPRADAILGTTRTTTTEVGEDES